MAEDKKYDIIDRKKIHLKAQRKLGLRKEKKEGDKSDFQDFMDQCVADLVDSGQFEDEEDAAAVCEMIYEEGGGD